ncbi:MAG: ATP-dependent DNA helicase RecG [Longimicrobiales bacterium]
MRGRLDLDRPAQFLKGVGPKRAESLARLGVHTARDLLHHTPWRYEDASTVTPIRSAEIGMDVTVIGEVTSKGVLPTRRGLRIFQVVLRDETGRIECSWPGQPFLDRTIEKGDILLAAGPVRFYHGRLLQPREWVILGRAQDGVGAAGKVLPIYASTEGLTQRMLRRILEDNLESLLLAGSQEEVFSAAELQRLGLPALGSALRAVHQPRTLDEAEQGRRRLAYEELFFLQLLHARAHHRATTERHGIRFRRSDRLIAPFYRSLPFTLTAAQTQALREILDDMTSARRMNRLLQGDVGSGKTVVALFAMLLALESGYQAALMAPTEILAEQHARTLATLLGLGAGAGAGTGELRPVLLTGRLPAAERRRALAAIAAGEAGLIVGTHALIQTSVRFARLGLVVVDEQHRFGVRQRLALAEQPAEPPDVLVMSATPIPRSLALTLYGDLDLSTLAERPAGRAPIKTAIRPARSRGAVYEFVREQVAAGRQAYLVYPLVEESDKAELRAATAEYERLSREVFAELRLGLLHGQLPADAKDAVMRAFAAGTIDVLVATTVIEVGIDVPNATVMVVEHAERFGLSQLHQLRGRVGRGTAQSYCVLLVAAEAESRQRLGILEDNDDGFEIARADLRLRGMGDFFGAKQHGLPSFRHFDPERDEDLLSAARAHTRALIDNDPELELPTHARFRERIEMLHAEREKLYDVG